MLPSRRHLIDETPKPDRSPRQSGSILGGAGVLVLGRNIVAALGWTGTVIVVRQLSQQEWGEYSLIVSLLGIVGFIADLKLSRIVLRDVIGADHEFAGEVVGSYVAAQARDRGRLVPGRDGVGVVDRVLLPRRHRRDGGRRAQPDHPLGCVRGDAAFRGPALAPGRRDRQCARPAGPVRVDGGDRRRRALVDPVVLVVDGGQFAWSSSPGWSSSPTGSPG